MQDEHVESTDMMSRRRLLRLGGATVAGASMGALAGCGLPGGGEGEEGEEEGGEDGGNEGGGEGGQEEDD